jgi:hypothetical protein
LTAAERRGFGENAREQAQVEREMAATERRKDDE